MRSSELTELTELTVDDNDSEELLDWPSEDFNGAKDSVGLYTLHIKGNKEKQDWYFNIFID